MPASVEEQKRKRAAKTLVAKTGEAAAANKPVHVQRPRGEERDEHEAEIEIEPKWPSFERARRKAATSDDPDEEQVRPQALAREPSASCYSAGLFGGAGCTERRGRSAFACMPEARCRHRRHQGLHQRRVRRILGWSILFTIMSTVGDQTRSKSIFFSF